MAVYIKLYLLLALSALVSQLQLFKLTITICNYNDITMSRLLFQVLFSGTVNSQIINCTDTVPLPASDNSSFAQAESFTETNCSFSSNMTSCKSSVLAYMHAHVYIHVIYC